MTERPFKKNHYFKKEIFYSYNNDGNLATETEAECHLRNECDSIFKKRYIYSLAGKLDSTVSYVWENKAWSEFTNKNAR